MTVALDVFAEDLFLFQKLEATAENRLAAADLTRAMERHKSFISQGFVVRDIEGQRVEGRIVDVAASPLPAEGIHIQDLMAHTIVYVLQYDFAKPPEYLTISQEFGGGQPGVPAFVTLSVKQEGGLPEPAAELPFGEAQSYRFDWDRPPLPPNASEEERRAWFAEQQEKQLGITDFNVTYSFLYIDDFEVRHEILMPLKTLEQWQKLQRRDQAFLEVDEQVAAREPLERFFAAANPVEIDGIPVRPVLSRLDFFGLDRRDFARPADQKRISAVSARVGIILSYSTKSPPRQVRVTWDQYNLYLWTVPAVIYAYDDILQFEFVQFGEPYLWTSPGRAPLPPVTAVSAAATTPPRSLSVPAGSLVLLLILAAAIVWLAVRRAAWLSYAAAICLLGGAAAVAAPFSLIRVRDPFHKPPQLTDQAAREIFATLHKNVYRAFDYRDENAIYDTLAASVDGQLRQDLYVLVRRGLEMQEQGGAVSRIRAVELVAGHIDPARPPRRKDPRGFTYRCTWQVEGTVEHWGHIHTRRNEYEAVFDVEPRDQQWKITGMKPLGEKRLKYETGLRMASPEQTPQRNV